MNQWARPAILGILIFGLAPLGGCPTPASPTLAPPEPTTISQATAQVTSTTVPTVPAVERTPTAVVAAPSPTPTTKGIADLLQKASTVKGVRYNQVITASTGEKVTTKVAMKGDKFRIEMQAEGQASVMIADGAAKVAYMLFPAQKMAMKISYEQFQQEGAPDSPTEMAEWIDPNARIVGAEAIEGKSTSVVEFSSPEGTMRAWIWNDFGIPIKIEGSSPQGTMTMELKDIDTSEPPDSLFEVPAGYQVVELPVGPPGVPGR